MEFDWGGFVVTVLIICVTVYNCLKHALELNLVCMTIPDKPNSKNQRYIKK